MTKSFNISTTTKPNILLARAKEIAGINGANLCGDTNAGKFSGKGVKGTYRLNERSVYINITEKPWYAPWPTVESTIRSFFA
ncbi:MAG: hypothetical protein ACUZ8O_01435 [Candidatus Anammoxibacter sp.]